MVTDCCPYCRQALPERRHFDSVAKIIARVAEVSGVSAKDIIGQRLLRLYARPRLAVYWIAAIETDKSLPQIGRVMRRDHTTVLSGIRRAEALLKTDQAFCDLVSQARSADGQGALL